MSNFKTLFLALVATAAWSSSNAFVPTVTTTKNQKDYQLRPVSSSTLLQAEPGKTQPLYGKELEMPETFVRCGKCQTIYAITENDLGEKGRGRRLECSVCGHSWFQSKDRIMELQDGYEMVERPNYELGRIQQNLDEQVAPNFLGEAKLYVGNIAFECQEQDIYDIFAEVGSVGDVSLVRDDEGKNRGFGFVTMRTNEDGEKAIQELNGEAILGRNIAVRPSNN